MYNLFSLVKYIEKNSYELLSSESKKGFKTNLVIKYLGKLELLGYTKLGDKIVE